MGTLIRGAALLALSASAAAGFVYGTSLLEDWTLRAKLAAWLDDGSPDSRRTRDLLEWRWREALAAFAASALAGALCFAILIRWAIRNDPRDLPPPPARPPLPFN
jgi:hypothetical protein